MPSENTLPSLRSILNYASTLLQLPFLSNTGHQTPCHSSSASRVYTPYSNGPTCPIDSPLSCHNTTASADSCCFIYPGGQLLQTQFWDTHPSIGPADSWTLHGLWPDLCDGSYPTFCTFTPHYYNVSSILRSASQTDLLATMRKYWLPNAGSPESFWEHEWNKHGTCVNTLSPRCYDESYRPGDEVVDFFTRAVEVFKALDTYRALEQFGIVPSLTRRYSREAVMVALRSVTGADVVLGCRGGALNQAWYSFNVKGSLQTGEFVAAEPVGRGMRGNCPAKGIRYLPKRAYSAEEMKKKEEFVEEI